MPYYLTQEEVAEIYRLSTRTLEGWRYTETNGPGFVKFGNRVRYPRDEVKRFAEENFHQIVKYQKSPGEPLNWGTQSSDGDEDFGHFFK